MISIPAISVTMQYQQAAALTARGDTTDRQSSDSRSFPPVQGTGDNVAVSEQGRTLARKSINSKPESDQDSSGRQSETSNTGSSGQSDEMSADDQATLQELQSRDREVRTHEQAHLAAAGQYARGGASFVYQRGPDGKVYAVGGEVSIDLSSESSPQATVAKMQTVMRAALAPAQPSATDRQVASQAAARLNQAQQQIQQQQMEESGSRTEKTDNPETETSENESISSSAPPSVSHTRKLMIDTYKAVNEYL